VKNAIDAMKGRGSLALITQDQDQVRISVKDSGSGITKNQFKTIFEPGLQQKGWD
jgi:signal transduction histidine kinase